VQQGQLFSSPRFASPMAPKGKAKAKAKGKAGKGGDEVVPTLEVPLPPPEPICLPLPENLADKCATERCLLLTWLDPLFQYKLQMRPHALGEVVNRTGNDKAWVDVKDKERVNLHNRMNYQAWLVNCEHVHLEYRLVSEKATVPIDGLYVANWASAPSEPVSSYVDPPIELTGVLCYESDVMPPSVSLSWTCASVGWLKGFMGEGAQLNEHGPIAVWPGMLPVKVQVRWRVVRPLSGVDMLPSALANGRHFTSAAIDNLRREAVFDFKSESWRMTYRDVVHGIVVRFSVRLGTNFRWSPWSEESDDIEVEVPEPSPFGLQVVRGQAPLEDAGAESSEPVQESTCLELRKLSDREAQLCWPPFVLAGSLSAIEYRVTLCQLDHEDEDPSWDTRGVALKTFILQKQPDNISTLVQHLHPNTWYAVRVDARYPYVGKRQFSFGKALCPRFRTPFPARPPLQPLPTVVADNLLPQGGDYSSHEGDLGEQRHVVEFAENNSFDWERFPWVALRVERSYLSDYEIEFKDAASPVQRKTLGSGRESDIGSEYFEAWRKPSTVVVLRSEAGGSRKSTDSGEDGNDDGCWCIALVGLAESAPEVVTCRLVHRGCITDVSPLRWSVVTPPLVPLIAPVSFAQPAAWAHVTDEGVQLALRFLLHPGAVSMDEHSAHLALTGTAVRLKLAAKPGHRYVTRYQVRFRAEQQGSRDSQPPDAGASWVTVEPALLPPASQAHGVVVPKGSTSVEESFREAENLSAHIGWLGARYEVDVDPGSDSRLKALLRGGANYEAEVRVGNDYRWSRWASVPAVVGPMDDESLTFSLPVPSPMAGAQLECAAQSATRLALSWPPFDRYPGVTRVDYVVSATPIFNEPRHEAGLEGGEVVERVFPVQHTTRMTTDELLASWEVRSLLEDAREMSLKKLSAAVDAERENERDQDRKQGNRIRVELAGLLPCTRYDVRVSAKYPTAAAVVAVGGNFSLSVHVEMPGGDSPPSAPKALALNGEDDPEVRKVPLLIPDRPGYVLEYRAGGTSVALYDARDPSGSEFGGSWQEGDSPWRRVPSTTSVDIVSQVRNDGCKPVWALLPGFDQGKGRGSYPMRGPLPKERTPDVVEFRLCAAARSAAHPCRWAGGISSPMAVCFAPPRRPPKVRKVLSDDRWCLILDLELFKTAPVPVPVKLLSAANDEEEDNGDQKDEEYDHEFIELRRTHVVPRPPQEAWAGSAVGRIPVGYGHRMATLVEFRYSLQSAMTPLLRKQLEDKTLSRTWQMGQAVPIEPESLNGDRCTLELESDLGLLESGIYIFQVRVGDGSRWSAWSHTSNAFAFRVPPPSPPSSAAIGTQQPVTVEVVSSTVARVRWCDFLPAPGLTLLEYEVRATPQQVSHSRHSICAPISAYFEHRYRGGWIEKEVPNLLPFTPYVFLVRARYPRVGGRDWRSGPAQASEPVALERPVAAQDPPTPFAVYLEECEADEEQNVVTMLGGEPEGAGGARSVAANTHPDPGVSAPCKRVVNLAFPDEEDGVRYDLQYAHVLGDEQDTSDLRSSQCLWHSPVDVALVDGAGGELSRWQVRLPDLLAFRSEPLKLALLQRVRFRLHARFASEASTTRWWSSLSAPVATGFAEPDGAAAALVAAGDRLAVEVQFSLDCRLADAVAAVGVAAIRTQRTELDETLQEDRPAANSNRAGELPSPTAGGQQVWPRGFGHPFVTRYQLRVRYQLRKADAAAAAAGSGGGVSADGVTAFADAAAVAEVEWGPWDIQPDAALPKEADRGVMGAGWFARASNPQARWYSVEVPQMRGRALATGEVVQGAVRVGDGVRWSPWKVIKEISVAVPPPRPAREGDTARADWVGDVCTVTWGSAAGPIGLDTIEYQLMVEPDSNTLRARVGAVLIMPAATSRRDEAQVEAGGGGTEPRGKWRIPQGTLTGCQAETHTPLQASPRPSNRSARASILVSSEERAAQRAEQMVSVELRDLCTDLRYGFTVLARYPTVGPRTFTKIFEVPKVSWRQSSLASPTSGALAIARRICDTTTCPPTLKQIPAPKDGRLKRWLDSRFALLTWPSLEVCDDQRAPISTRYELQASEGSSVMGTCDTASVMGNRLTAGTLGDNPNDLGPIDLTCQGRAWWPCGNTTALTLDGVPCVAALNLPFFVGQFRLFDTVQQRAGPLSWPIVTMYEAISPAPVAEIQALGKGAPRSLGISLTISLAAPGGTQRRATRCQVRFRPLGTDVHNSVWEEVEPTALDTSSGDDVCILVREEDGLELGPAYEFAVRVGDKCRLGSWSSASMPLQFAVPRPVPQESGGIRTAVEAEKVNLSWPAFQPEASLATKMLGFVKLPMEYTVTVFRGSDNTPVTTFITCDTQVTVRMLVPSTAYSAMVSAHWTRFRTSTPDSEAIHPPACGGTPLATSLMAAFVTAEASKSLASEVSIRLPNDMPTLATVTFPVDDSCSKAMILDLDPHYAGVRSPKLPHAFVRKPPVPAYGHPSPRSVAMGNDEAVDLKPLGLKEGPPLAGRPLLPSLVPALPPKFTTRDPFNFGGNRGALVGSPLAKRNGPPDPLAAPQPQVEEEGDGPHS